MWRRQSFLLYSPDSATLSSTSMTIGDAELGSPPQQRLENDYVKICGNFMPRMLTVEH
jgi:hypothetical protein